VLKKGRLDFLASKLCFEYVKDEITKPHYVEWLKTYDREIQDGDSVFIFSASPDVYVHAVCAYLNCDGYLCSTLDYENGG